MPRVTGSTGDKVFMLLFALLATLLVSSSVAQPMLERVRFAEVNVPTQNFKLINLGELEVQQPDTYSVCWSQSEFFECNST